MYIFPDDVRRYYEKLSLPVIFMEYEDGVSVPLLVSDGFLKMNGVTRDTLHKYFNVTFEQSLLEKVHPDETERLKQINPDCEIEILH